MKAKMKKGFDLGRKGFSYIEGEMTYVNKYSEKYLAVDILLSFFRVFRLFIPHH
jgi:hypothetical protein